VRTIRPSARNAQSANLDGRIDRAHRALLKATTWPQRAKVWRVLAELLRKRQKDPVWCAAQEARLGLAPLSEREVEDVLTGATGAKGKETREPAPRVRRAA
jgi:acyl-CoA reductase-like NAD-dependent aldehyde dehydrogenase